MPRQARTGQRGLQGELDTAQVGLQEGWALLEAQDPLPAPQSLLLPASSCLSEAPAQSDQAAYLLEVAPLHGAVLHLSEVHIAEVVRRLPLEGARVSQAMPHPDHLALPQGWEWQEACRDCSRWEPGEPGGSWSFCPCLLATKAEARRSWAQKVSNSPADTAGSLLV